ncbi:MAG: PIN domain-containing protein [Candidatus Omnitrophota bacterium]
MNANIFFDTNILLYSYVNQDPRKKSVAEDYISDAMRYGIGVVSIQVLGEFVVNAHKKLVPVMTLKQARGEMEMFASGMRVFSLDVSDVRDAIHIAMAHQLNYWDALVITSAQKAKCRTLLTEDLNHGQKFGHLQVVNPFLR